MNQATLAATAVLSEYDFILIGDASGSMGTTDMPGGRSRWAYMQESMMSFARDLAAYDTDGVGLVLFGGSNVTAVDGQSAADIEAAFAARSPRGGTPLAEALEAALKLAGKSDKKDFIMVFTDGVPDDKARAAAVITAASNRQETDDALTILFVQVGHDRDATAYLQRLDDDLKGKFDIVDAKTMDEAEKFATTADLVVAAING